MTPVLWFDVVTGIDVVAGFDVVGFTGNDGDDPVFKEVKGLKQTAAVLMAQPVF